MMIRKLNKFNIMEINEIGETIKKYCTGFQYTTQTIQQDGKCYVTDDLKNFVYYKDYCFQIPTYEVFMITRDKELAIKFFDIILNKLKKHTIPHIILYVLPEMYPYFEKEKKIRFFSVGEYPIEHGRKIYKEIYEAYKEKLKKEKEEKELLRKLKNKYEDSDDDSDEMFTEVEILCTVDEK
jgi:hypothetical protein